MKNITGCSDIKKRGNGLGTGKVGNTPLGRPTKKKTPIGYDPLRRPYQKGIK